MIPRARIEDSYVEEEHHVPLSRIGSGLAGAGVGAGLAAMHHHHAHVEDDEHDDPELLEDTHGYYHQEVHLLFDMSLCAGKARISPIQVSWLHEAIPINNKEILD